MECHYGDVILSAMASQIIRLAIVCSTGYSGADQNKHQTKAIRSLQPTVMFYMFDVLIRPILTYGSDVWGFNKTVANTLDKVLLNYNRCILQVEATTRNAIVYGECGKFPPSVYCHWNVLSYYHRLLTMPEGKVVISVFNMLFNLSEQGFQTWSTRVCELALAYNININETANMKSDQFKSLSQNIVKQDFIDKWNCEVKGNPSTILKTYALYESQYVTEAYLGLISNPKHRIAPSKLRASSHNLEIERGRYTRPIINPDCVLCVTWLTTQFILSLNVASMNICKLLYGIK